jgi:transposase-like protein
MIPSPRQTQVEDSSETEGARSATGVTEDEGPSRPRLARQVPDPEVPAKAQRRKFTAEYKLRIVREAERCKEPGEIGALLRREGLYSSLLTAWRREVEEGTRAALRSKKRGPKARVVDPRVKEVERENARLRKRLEHAELIIAVQKKVSALLGIPLESPDDETN